VAKRAIKEFEIMNKRPFAIKRKKNLIEIKKRCHICGEIISAKYNIKILTMKKIISNNNTTNVLNEPTSIYDESITLNNGKEICINCFNKLNCYFIHNHRSNGEKLNIDDLETIKVRFEHIRDKIFNLKTKQYIYNTKLKMKCYITLYSLKNSGRNNGFGKDNEITINDEFMPFGAPSYERFQKRILYHALRARIKEKQTILQNEKLIKYMYNCFIKTLKVGLDKTIFGL